MPHNSGVFMGCAVTGDVIPHASDLDGERGKYKITY